MIGLNSFFYSEKDTKMPITEHIVELRKRLLQTIIWLLVISIISFINIDFITKKFITYDNVQLIYTAPSDIVKAHISIALFIGFIFTIPIIVYQVWKFTKPAINETYHKKIIGILIFFILLFYVGLIFSYIAVLPLVLKFLTEYSSLKQVEPVYQIDKFYSFIFSMIIMFGIIFEMPLVITALGIMRLINVKMMRASRKYSILIIFILATILSPPDVISQFLMAIPMLFLFELSLGILKHIEMRRVNE